MKNLFFIISFALSTVCLGQEVDFDLKKQSLEAKLWLSKLDKEDKRDLKLQILKQWLLSGLSEIKRSNMFPRLPQEIKEELLIMENKVTNITFYQTVCDDPLITARAGTGFTGIEICNYFWNEEPRSQFGTLIHEVLHTLGYGHDISHSRRLSFYYLLIAPPLKISKESLMNTHVEGIHGRQSAYIPEIVEILKSKKFRRLNSNTDEALIVWTNYFYHSSCEGTDGCRETYPGIYNY